MSHLDYGVVGNCRTAALVSKKGGIDWMCLPDFDSPSVFAKILDTEKGGSFSFQTEGYAVSQKYLDNTNILCTTFDGGENAFEVLDFMPRYKIGDYNYYLPPEICRYIRLLRGKPSVRICYEPALNYARGEMVHEQGAKYIESYVRTNERESIYLYSSLPLEKVLDGSEIMLTRHEFLLLSYNQKLIPIDVHRVYLDYQRTKVYWLNWNNRARKFTAYNDIIVRSMLVLKLMTYQRTGAVLAALTTSIPETIGEVRNWDYRFCWLRDASMSIETLLKVGHHGAAKRFMNFIQRIIDSKYNTFQIMYGIRGELKLTEETLDHLAGYMNSRPVRIGNAAYNQKQHDSFGYLMDVIYQYYYHFPGTLDEVEDMWEIVKNIACTVALNWRKPDRGIWEIRNEARHFVFSKVMCWVALDRAFQIAKILNMGDFAVTWKKEANKIQEDVLQNGWKEEIQSFSQAYDNLDMDSALLLMEAYGFISPEDERFKKTVAAVKQALFHKGLMFRYNNADDFGVPRSAFTICTFWLIRALYVTGEKEEARELFNRIITYGNHLGLFSEDLDFESKSQLGNFPQAYSHLALINTSILLSEEKPLSPFIRP